MFGRLHPDDHDRVSADIMHSARTLETFYCEFRVVLPRQGLRWRWSQAHPERTEDGGTLWHGIISDITERKLAEEEIRRQAEQLRRTVEGAVLAMSHVVETRDPYTAGHERRVAELAAAIGAEMGLAGDELEALRLAALIHDIGKIAVPAEILAKPGRSQRGRVQPHPRAPGLRLRHPRGHRLRQRRWRRSCCSTTSASTAPATRAGLAGDADPARGAHHRRGGRRRGDVVAPPVPGRPGPGGGARRGARAAPGVRYDADVVAVCVRLFREQGFTLTP